MRMTGQRRRESARKATTALSMLERHPPTSAGLRAPSSHSYRLNDPICMVDHKADR